MNKYNITFFSATADVLASDVVLAKDYNTAEQALFWHPVFKSCAAFTLILTKV